MSKISDLMKNCLQDVQALCESSLVSNRRRRAPANEFGRELHEFLGAIGLKRSAFGERGYTYSLHKQICRGERPPSPRALASLERMLNHRLEVLLAAKQATPAKLEQLIRRLKRFAWVEAPNPNGHYNVNATALGRLWRAPQPAGHAEGLPLLLEGKLTDLKLPAPADGPLPRLRFRHQRFTLTTSKSGQMRLTVTLTRTEAERLRRLLPES